jgi:hypothetical protein
VYLVMSHTAPDQVLRLLRTIRVLSPGAHLVVHHDERWVRLDRYALATLGVTYLPSQSPIRWGEPTQLEALLRALREVHSRFDYQWVIHLSGQDYPIRPLAELEALLLEGSAHAYLPAEVVGSRGSVVRRLADDNVRRYFFRYFRAPARLQRSSRKGRSTGGGRRPALAGSTPRPRRWAAAARRLPLPIYVRRLPRGLGVRVGFWQPWAPFPRGYPCYKGSNWVTLSRPAVGALLTELDRRPALLRYYRRTLNPDESLIPTVLFNHPDVAVHKRQLRYTSWPPGSAHPDVLTVDRLAELRASRKFLARKFDAAVDATVLDDLDRMLGVLPVPPPASCPRGVRAEVTRAADHDET